MATSKAFMQTNSTSMRVRKVMKNVGATIVSHHLQWDIIKTRTCTLRAWWWGTLSTEQLGSLSREISSLIRKNQKDVVERMLSKSSRLSSTQSKRKQARLTKIIRNKCSKIRRPHFLLCTKLMYNYFKKQVTQCTPPAVIRKRKRIMPSNLLSSKQR